MKTSLSIGFNDGHRFTHDYIKIEDTPIVPVEAQAIRIFWEDFVTDKALVDKLEEFEEEAMFLAHVVSVSYRKGEVITNLMLMEERDYYNYTLKRDFGK
jgi:hypothetical protein